ncbi:hypothetical protein [Klebsiella pneumoniae IS22]|nr:hypothetical protein [Klebsiella pneumoniae IS22]
MLFLTASVIYRVTGFGRGVSEENCPPQARRAERLQACGGGRSQLAQ